MVYITWVCVCESIVLGWWSQKILKWRILVLVSVFTGYFSKYSCLTHTHTQALTRPELNMQHDGENYYSTFGQTSYPCPVSMWAVRWMGTCAHTHTHTGTHTKVQGQKLIHRHKHTVFAGGTERKTEAQCRRKHHIITTRMSTTGSNTVSVRQKHTHMHGYTKNFSVHAVRMMISINHNWAAESLRMHKTWSQL